MSEILVRAIADLAAFLALSGDDVVQPDAAVGQLEQLAHKLRGLGTRERTEFLKVVDRIRREEQDPERQQFFGGLGDNLGLR